MTNHLPSNDLRLRMAGMRLPALMPSADGAYYELAVAPDAYPPRITGGQHVPLWKMLPAPTPANTETGPLSGLGFFAPMDCSARSGRSGPHPAGPAPVSRHGAVSRRRHPAALNSGDKRASRKSHGYNP